MKKNTSAPPTYHISLTYDLLKTALQKRLKESGLNITAEQLGILKLLSQHDCVSIGSISEHTFRNSSTVTRMIDNLVKNKLVQRVASKSDRRVKHICLSDTGKEIYLRAAEVANQHVTSAMRGIPETDIDNLTNILNNIQSNLKSIN